MEATRVLLADGQRLVLEGLEKLVGAEFDVVGAVVDGRSLLEAAALHTPDVIVLETAMRGLNGIDAAAQLREASPQTKIVFLTNCDDTATVREAFLAGAVGYVLKTGGVAELFQAIREVQKGGVYVTPTVSQGLVEVMSGTVTSKQALTPRQLEVLQLLAEGHSMRAVAEILNVTPRTVAFHKYRMMDSLGLSNSAELIQYALRHGIGSA